MVRRNLIANFGGKIWIALVSLIFVPVYLKILGIDGYGLISVLMSLQAMLAVFDFGLSHTITREYSKLSIIDRQRPLDMLKTYECCYWGVAALLGIAIYLASGLIANWLNYKSLDRETAHLALQIFAIAFALNWPTTLYGGALTGLEKMVSVNLINAMAATARNGGGALILWMVAPSIPLLVAWQALVNVASAIALRTAVKQSLGPASRRGQFDMELLRATARYAIGVSSILIVYTLLSQLDRVALSGYVTLDEFGLYVLAISLAGVLNYLSSPVTTAFFPRFVRAYTQNEPTELARSYHLSCQLVALLVLPFSATLFFYAEDILRIWTRNATIAEEAAPIVRILALSVGLSQLAQNSFSLQSACGWNRLAFWQHASAVAIMVALLTLLIPRFGTIGAAYAWLILFALQAAIGPYLMHQRLLKGQYWTWFSRDIAVPAVIAFVFIGGIAACLPKTQGDVAIVIGASAACIVAMIVQLLVSPALLVQVRIFFNRQT